MAGIGHNRSQTRQQVLDDLFSLALTATSQNVQVSACVAWLNLVEGKPVAMAVRASAAGLSALDDADLEPELRLHAAHLREKARK